jgi:antitoxin MazE
MKTSVIRIGNSQGIRIPKTLLEQCRLGGTVELEVHKDHLVIRPVVKPRSGWEESFRRMTQQGDDVLLDRESLPRTQWDETEWEW